MNTMLENMIFSDIQIWHGLALIDPCGNIADRILEIIPSKLMSPGIYFIPINLGKPIG